MRRIFCKGLTGLFSLNSNKFNAFALFGMKSNSMVDVHTTCNHFNLCPDAQCCLPQVYDAPILY